MASRVPLYGRVLLIGGAALGMLLLLVLVVPALRDLTEGPAFPPPGDLSAPAPAIASEAHPFRSRPGELAVGPEVERRADAQPRSMAIYRSLRAYPGAPPRIPHGLTEEEFRKNLCNSCHVRGGFAPRFSAYTPVTPHPEYADCLQCHVPDAMTVGIGIPQLTSDVICSQCHVDPDEPPPSLVSIDWSPMAWPELDQRAMDGSPTWIPHTLQLRENCLACHGGPSALEGIRTTHPERADCRSCHVPMDDPADVFTRPLDGGAR